MKVIARSQAISDAFGWSGLVEGRSYNVVKKNENGFYIDMENGKIRWFHYMFFGMNKRSFDSFEFVEYN